MPARSPGPWWWDARKAYYCIINGKRRRLAEDKQEAWKVYYELMAKKDEPEIPAGSIHELAEAFMDWTQKNRAKRTYDWYQERIELFLKAVDPLPANEIRPYHVQPWVDDLPGGDTYKHGCVTAVKRIFNWGVQMGYLQFNPIKALEKPEAGKRENLVSPEEFAEILSYVRDQGFADLLRFVWFTGCRPQEAVRVEKRHYDTQHRRFVLPKDEAKGRKRMRVIYLPDLAVDIAKRNFRPEGPIFRNTKGRPWTAMAVNCRFDRLKKHIGRKVAMYDVRHSYATEALKKGVDPVTLATILGHADTSMLAKVYANLSQDPEYLREAAKKATE